MIIEQIIKQKKERWIFPIHARLQDIRRLYKGDNLTEELERLVALKIVITGDTINDKYFKINE